MEELIGWGGFWEVFGKEVKVEKKAGHGIGPG